MSLLVQVKQYISMFSKYDMLYAVSDGSYTASAFPKVYSIETLDRKFTCIVFTMHTSSIVVAIHAR